MKENAAQDRGEASRDLTQAAGKPGRGRDRKRTTFAARCVITPQFFLGVTDPAYLEVR